MLDAYVSVCVSVCVYVRAPENNDLDRTTGVCSHIQNASSVPR